MVDTMALLLPFLRGPRIRMTRTAPPPPGPHADEVLLDVPDARLGPALVAAARGEHEPAAALLAATRAAGEWEHRDRYTTRLAAFAHARPEWFESWRAAAPRDPDRLVVDAQLRVDRAWRSPARAELLREVSPLVTAAAHGDDRDPVPWRIALDHARGAQAGPKYVEELWSAAMRRAPHHYGCHVAALRYLASSFHGSHHECLDFADRAAQDAPPGSLVQALPVRAAFAYLTDGCGPEVAPAPLHAAAERAMALSAALPAADPWPAEQRNVLTYVLVRLGRVADALEQVRLTGPYATSFPWDRFSDDPLGHCLRVRDELRGASDRPGGGHHGRARSGDH
ncbi:hypothetical protein STRCI_002263 [Streptomyces cinnabarinus]|uniref:DUF4034 domain-containing protein n=1 Tax=Streptomyces cinnabarinus TaxID=67287 RepID=A0ABY7K9B0_9ACTN|nr:hypothetical protein [Streptomyces cinnabarinus]WAZ21106.1 hypothetical protein STRCI_002263 [Streptomyces cinnabarinus]